MAHLLPPFYAIFKKVTHDECTPHKYILPYSNEFGNALKEALTMS